ncbi:hypothetical protein [Phytobacter sp. RSE-02]|uniref:hypothetical protein n=1 Tax=Phytobacter sp. RSE-02 TaxID=3229229 RepID=UPI00339D30CA
MTDKSMNQRIIAIQGKSYLVSCHQKSTDVWVAIGDFNDKPVREKGDSKEEAFANWQRVVLFLAK